MLRNVYVYIIITPIGNIRIDESSVINLDMIRKSHLVFGRHHHYPHNNYQQCKCRLLSYRKTGWITPEDLENIIDHLRKGKPINYCADVNLRA